MSEQREAVSTRTIRYLRVSLTDRCNFRCLYCFPRGGLQEIPRSEVLRFDELLHLIGLMVDRFALTKVRVTGGEPLIRKGACEFLRRLCRLPGLGDVALTTNGYFLADHAGELRHGGLRRVNISLDTFRPDRFRWITGVDGLDRVRAGIEAALSLGFRPLKLNVVVMRENLDEVLDFVAYGLETGIEARFIERMPGNRRRDEDASAADPSGSGFVPNSDVRAIIEGRHRLTRLPPDGEPGSSAVRYLVDGGPCVCGFISPMTEPFCAVCNRIRLRGDGKLVPCLRQAARCDLMPFIRPSPRADEITRAIEQVLRDRRRGRDETGDVTSMTQIGG